MKEIYFEYWKALFSQTKFLVLMFLIIPDFNFKTNLK
jgi:hypothetical protein